MIVIKDTDLPEEVNLVATIGFFDGVHLGHRFLIDRLKQTARESGLPAAVITFSRHPREVLHSVYQPQLLNSFEEKLSQLASTGIDYCIVLDFTIELSRLTAKEFIHTVLADRLHVKQLLIGHDHRFGHDRTDGFGQYVEYGRMKGMEVIQAPAYDEGETIVSSSEIRRLITACRIEDANQLLTYSYQLKGDIVSGYKVGRTLGFPTANIRVDDPNKIVPGIGVYAVCASVKGNEYAGMLYIGNRPTIGNGTDISLEVNLLDFSGDIYNDKITVSFLHFIRGDIKFSSLDQLKEQLRNDRETVRQLMTK